MLITNEMLELGMGNETDSKHAYKCSMNCVGFEVFTAVVMKSIIFWDIMPCSPLCRNRRLGGT
jgi:hypothetical protein